MNYSLIYADPPWKYGNQVSRGAANDHYETMTLPELKRLPVWKLAHENAVLAMWYTGTHTEEARELAAAWGFDVRTMKGFTWIKLNQRAEQRFNSALAEQQLLDFDDLLEMLNAETKMNPGSYTRANSEDVLIAVRGTGIERASAGVKQVIFSCLGEHSEKPAEARFRLERLYGDVPRVELFARQRHEGWDAWGNSCGNSFELITGAVVTEHTALASETQALYDEVTCSVWPAEVALIFEQIPDVAQLDKGHQLKIKYHINRMLLEHMPSAAIVNAVTTLKNLLQGAAA